jgi:hypothetical protein
MIPPMRPPWVVERVEGRADEADVEDRALEAEESGIEEWGWVDADVWERVGDDVVERVCKVDTDDEGEEVDRETSDVERAVGDAGGVGLFIA